MSARQPASVVSKPRSITTVPVAETELSRLEEAAIDEKEEQKLQILRDRMERIRGEKERLKKIQELEVLEEQTKKEILNMQKRAGGGSGS
jgi:TolA-binding protein